MERAECSPELLDSLKAVMGRESKRKGIKREVVKAEVVVQKVTPGLGYGTGTSSKEQLGEPTEEEPGSQHCI
jgi:hypothetical protein